MEWDRSLRPVQGPSITGRLEPSQLTSSRGAGRPLGAGSADGAGKWSPWLPSIPEDGECATGTADRGANASATTSTAAGTRTTVSDVNGMSVNPAFQSASGSQSDVSIAASAAADGTVDSASESPGSAPPNAPTTRSEATAPAGNDRPSGSAGKLDMTSLMKQIEKQCEALDDLPPELRQKVLDEMRQKIMELVSDFMKNQVEIAKNFSSVLSASAAR